jgi:predicted nucleotide-binding protein (sugar kinase/HSP70/actin superfamily)
METPNEYLKRISPNDNYGIREHLEKERLRGVVENIMQKYAEYYYNQQLILHSVTNCEKLEDVIELNLLINDKKSRWDRVDERLKTVLKQQKKNGKEFINNSDVDKLIDQIIKEERD